jgi:hypothetical protein
MDDNPWVCKACGGTTATKDGFTCPFCNTPLNLKGVDLDNDAIAVEWGSRKIVEMKKARAAKEAKENETGSSTNISSPAVVAIGSGATSVVITTSGQRTPQVIVTSVGSAASKVCPNCGTSNRPEANFCKECGKAF